MVKIKKEILKEIVNNYYSNKSIPKEISKFFEEKWMKGEIISKKDLTNLTKGFLDNDKPN